ncbi:MAG: hypothetical protein WDN26_05095 [Chitinophagaceae bacterium]
MTAVASNPIVEWETSTKSDIGVEARLLKGLFNIEIDLYKEIRTNILAQRSSQVPATYGAPLPAGERR